MADSYNKKEREKLKRKKKQDKIEKRKQRKLEGKTNAEFMYMDENGNLSPTPPDPNKKKKEIKLEDIQISTPKLSELDQEDTDRQGVVKFYNVEKHFGFISEAGAREDYFVHGDNLVDPIKENDKVVFELGTGPRGYVAINVRLSEKQ